MEGYGQFCSLAKALEIVGERWTLLVVRELVLGSRRFNEIRRGVPLMSPALLSQRLRSLERAGLVERRCLDGTKGHTYELTPAGRELDPLITSLAEWGQRWVRTRYAPEDLDPSFLMWDIRRCLRRNAFGPTRRVVEFRFPDAPAGKSSYWLVSSPDEADLCHVDPGYPVDLYVTSPLRVMVEIWVGDREVLDAIALGLLDITGDRDLCRCFPEWLGENPVRGVKSALAPA